MLYHDNADREVVDAAPLNEAGVPIITGPGERAGRTNGRLMSIYFYDPDENLIEVANENEVVELRLFMSGHTHMIIGAATTQHDGVKGNPILQ